jgi:hypothetical protein
LVSGVISNLSPGDEKEKLEREGLEKEGLEGEGLEREGLKSKLRNNT